MSRETDRNGTDPAPAGPEIDRSRFETPRDHDAFYRCPALPGPVVTTADREARGVRRTEIRFPSPLPSGVPANDTVRATLFDPPDPDAATAVVFLNGFGPTTLGAWEPFARTLARRGFPALVVCLPFVCERGSDGARGGLPYTSTSAVVALPAYEQAVADARRALDWLLAELAERRPGVRTRPVALGISMGALIAVIAAALEGRFEALIPILGGADLDIIVFRGAYRTNIQRELDAAGILIENRRRARRFYEEYLHRVREADHPLDVDAEFHFFLFDPLTFASHLRRTPALMINGRFDPIIPRAAARQLWLELGRPEISWIWGTHWAGGPWKPFVTGRIARFLEALPDPAVRTPRPGHAEVWIP